MRKLFVIAICIFALFASQGNAQSVPRELSPETRALINAQMHNMKAWYPVQNAEKQIAPPFMQLTPSRADMRAMLQTQSDFPLEKADLVLDILEFYLFDHQDDCAYLLAMSELHKNVSGAAFEAEKLPRNLMHLVLVSSGMNPEYASPAGALGAWQFMYSTGRLYKLRIDEYVDERREITRSSEAAAKMLSDFYRLYKDWPLAITAYACGPVNVNKALKKVSPERSFDAIYPYLQSPQRDMYLSFLAVNVLISNYKAFGIEPVSIPFPIEADTVFVDEDLHLGQLAAVANMDEALLCQLNPVYPKKIVPGTKALKLPLLVPVGKAADFIRLKDSIYTYNDSAFFNIKPIETEKSEVAENAEPYRPGNGFTAVDYTIKSGDNLGFISEWFDANISEIRYWNGIHGNSIRAGQKLVIYVPESKKSYYTSVDKLSFQQKQAREGKLVEQKKSPEPVKEELKPGEYEIYTVKSGDNPWSIAKKFPGVSDQDILRWNSIDPKGLSIGQKLKIKKLSK
ncbi:MAG: LysM peptidoglycan-binding domain-containing protein [Bacteroidales bacterium]|jgi:membrane-bound lytic murein transglycosylase D|nr:LysM peptidoglycan-binding domain-containing protein [Bacteroidales bacterium]